MRYIEHGDFDHQTYSGPTCISCNSIRKETHRGIFRLKQDEWGAYDVCESCITQAAAELGMLEADRAEKLRKSNRRYGSANKALQEQVEHYQQIVAGLYGKDEA